MSASDGAAPPPTTRLRSRSGTTKSLLHTQPEEELAKHQSRTKPNLRSSQNSMDQNPNSVSNTRSPDHHHHRIIGHVEEPPHFDYTATTSRSKSKLLNSSSTRDQPVVSLSTQRALSYGPSNDDLLQPHYQNSEDFLHSLDAAHSTDTQSSSKTLPPADGNTTPPSTALQNTSPFISIFCSKDVCVHIFCSLVILSLLMLAVSHAGVPPPHRLIRSFKSMRLWKQSMLATSSQMQELKDHILLTLTVTTERLENRVEGLKSEMWEEMKRRKQEAEEIREEIIRQKQKIFNEEEDHKKLLSFSHVDRPDYALGSGGGRVVGHSMAYKPTSSSSALSGIFAWTDRLPAGFGGTPRLHPLAHIILQPSFNQPGQCLPLATTSSDVYVVVALRTPIFPDQVTLSHVSKSIAYDISSAPKEFQLYGLPPAPAQQLAASWVLLGEFTYDINKPVAVQAFHLSDTTKKTLISSLKLNVLSNYGSPSHTCIYRLQVHGKESL